MHTASGSVFVSVCRLIVLVPGSPTGVSPTVTPPSPVSAVTNSKEPSLEKKSGGEPASPLAAGVLAAWLTAAGEPLRRWKRDCA